MIASDVDATDTLDMLGIPTMTAATIASTAVIARITSSTAIACQAVRSWPAAEYHGRKSATSMSNPPAAASQSPRLRRRSSIARRLNERGTLEAGGLDGVGEQHRDRHRADPSRHRRDGGSLFGDRFEVHVADQAVVGPVDAHVDDHCTVTHHLSAYELGATHRGHQHVGTRTHFGEVPCA